MYSCFVDQSTRLTRLTGWPVDNEWAIWSLLNKSCAQFSLVHIYHVFLLCWPVDQVDQSTRSTGQQWMGNLISIKQELCTFSLVHICHVFLLCWPVDQVNRSTSWQWMGKLISIKQELCTFSLMHIYHVFLLCQPVDRSTRSTGWLVNNEWAIWSLLNKSC